MTQRSLDIMLIEAMVENLKLYEEWKEEHFGVQDAKLHDPEGVGELGVDSGNVREPAELPGVDAGESGDLGIESGTDNQHSQVLV